MKLIFPVLQIVSTLWACSTYSQKFSNSDMESIRNNERVSYRYKDSLIGCNYDMNCKGFNVSFNEVSYDKKSKNLLIKGTVFWETANRPLPGVIIFVAKPRNGKLQKPQALDSTYKKPHLKDFPFGMGDFNSSFKLRKGYKLYFSHESFYLVEFDINRLKRLSN